MPTPDPIPSGAGLTLPPTQVRLSAEQRACLVAAAAAARVTLSEYLRESALMVAREEGHVPAAPERWTPAPPRRRAKAPK